MYIGPLPPESPSHLLPIPTCLGYYRALFEFPESYRKFPLAIYLHMSVYMHPCYSLHLSHPLPLSPTLAHKSLLYVCISAAALLQIYQYHPSGFHMYVYINLHTLYVNFPPFWKALSILSLLLVLSSFTVVYLDVHIFNEIFEIVVFSFWKHLSFVSNKYLS